MCSVSTMLPIHILSFIKVALLRFELSQDSYIFFNILTDSITIATATTIFMRWGNKNKVHNQHMTTCTHAEFCQASE